MRVVIGTFDHDRLAKIARRDPATLFVSTRCQTCARRGAVVALPSEQFKMLTVMLGGVARLATKDAVIEAFLGDRKDGGPDDVGRLINVRLCALRKQLAPLGVFVETEWGQGWRMWGDTAPGDKVHERPERAEASRPARDSDGRAGSAGARSVLPLAASGDTGSTRRRKLSRDEPAFMVGVR